MSKKQITTAAAPAALGPYSQGIVAGGFADVLKTTVFLTDLANFAEVNGIYAEYFVEPFPARSCVQIAALPKGSLLEVELIAKIPE